MAPDLHPDCVTDDIKMNRSVVLLKFPTLLGIVLVVNGCSTREALNDSKQHGKISASSVKTEKMIIGEISIGDSAGDLKVLMSEAKIPFSVSLVDGGEKIDVWILDEKRLLYKTYIHAIVTTKNGLLESVDRESIGVGL